ncbi:MAG: UvrD-helicase domain-containing protein [Anaerolineaceae bacterium]|nr:UvrD-helicase domain-containing protein [Anaerolineaceae bacterium]
MAVVYGSPGLEAGDQRVCKALETLPADSLIYAQPLLVHHAERREPDYVIVNPQWGVIVLEVKDWVQIRAMDARGLEVYRTKLGYWESVDSPVDQARQAAFVLVNRLAEDPELRNYAGKLDFSYTYGAILPNLFGTMVKNCNYHWGQNYVLGKDDLLVDRITEKIRGIPTQFRVVMTDAQVRAVCAVLDGRNVLRDRHTGEFKGVLDQTQESIAKEGLVPLLIEPVINKEEEPNQQTSLFGFLHPEPEHRKKHLESEVPDEVMEVQHDLRVRLVRGFAGTGKTDVLVLRAHYLAEQYPKHKILVTTFNDPLYQTRLMPELAHLKKQVDVRKFDGLCSEIYQKRNGRWKDPQPIRGMLAWMAERSPLMQEWGIDFLADEFTWMKEAGRTEAKAYMEKPREGRGGSTGRTLSTQQKKQIFHLFEEYQAELAEQSMFDWADLHDKTLKYLQDGVPPDTTYDVILIDEAQHFAPTWMKIIKTYLKPEGVLFLCDDPSQSVYRYFSWRQKGIDVVGKTRWLKVPYRNSRQIFEASYALLSGDELAKSLLGEDKNMALPDLSNANLRNGNLPVIRQFETVQAEKQFILDEILRLVAQGLRVQDICILHNQKYVLDAYKEVKKMGGNVENAITQTGMEYTAVFIPQTQKLFDRAIGKSWEEDQSQQRLTSYMLMTRARSHLYMTYQQKWPKALDPTRPYVDWVEVAA